jgi:predicted O-methyltransferase YrrM
LKDVEAERLTAPLRQAYEQYVGEVSSPAMAISLETAFFLSILCSGIQPKRILDLGSGFSSYVFRLFAAGRDDVTVWSVDDDGRWLDRTRDYLLKHGLSAANLSLWADFAQVPTRPAEFDLVFHDLGAMQLRQNVLELVFDLADDPDGVMILDDMHKLPYAKHVRALVRRRSLRYFDLLPFTLDQYQRFSGLVARRA